MTSPAEWTRFVKAVLSEDVLKLHPECETEINIAVASLKDSMNEFEAFNIPAANLPQEAKETYLTCLRKRTGGIPFVKQAASVVVDIFNYAANAEKLWQQSPYFYDKAGLFWVWEPATFSYVQSDEVDLVNAIDMSMGNIGKGLSNKYQYVEALRHIGRRHIPKELQRTAVQFQNTVVDIKTGERFQATSAYFTTNPIPWPLVEGQQTPVIDKLFNQWVGHEKSVSLKEILAFCMSQEYFCHRFFVFLGSGRNGKGTFLRLLNKFIGDNNCTSSDLDLLLKNRFETSKLYRKSACLLGETDYGRLSNTSMLKRLTGQDKISFEHKGKQPIDGENYAKIIIASNGLPATADKSDGFYRRPLIIEFPHNFEESDVLSTIPENEYAALTGQLLTILCRLYKERKFTGEGTIEERAKAYEKHSNPLPEFIAERCEKGYDKCVRFGLLYLSFIDYCKLRKFRLVPRKEFGVWLADENIEYRKCSKNGEFDTWIEGYALKTTQTTQTTHLSLALIEKKVSESTVVSVVSVGDWLKEQPAPVPFETLFEKFPNVPVETELLRLKNRNEIFEPRPGHWAVIR